MHLVFAGKRVGYQLIRYMIERSDKIALVVAANTNVDQQLVDYCREHGVACEPFSAELCERLVAANRHYEWLLNLWSPHILGPSLLSLAGRRVNAHPSLVPSCRGADSSAWIIRRGEPAGVSLIEMDATVDTGAIYAQKGIVIPFPIRGSELHSLLQEEIIALFRSAWPRMLSGELQPVPQLPGGSSFRRKQTNLDRVRDANMMMPLKETVLWMLAHDFYPGTTAELEESGERYRLRIFVEKIG